MTTENLFTEEEVARIEAIMIKRAKAYLDNYSPSPQSSLERHEQAKQAKAESTSSADYDFMNALYRRLPRELQEYVRLTEEMWGDFGKYRCSVCGLTEKQAEAINYNCTLEC